ncbi:MAG: glycoside hydrolase family 3 N-terminal domain-containing protein [Chloroflexota bacterium]
MLKSYFKTKSFSTPKQFRLGISICLCLSLLFGLFATTNNEWSGGNRPYNVSIAGIAYAQITDTTETATVQASVAVSTTLPVDDDVTPSPISTVTPELQEPEIQQTAPPTTYPEWLDVQVERIVANMTVSEKVGQLFMLTFRGDSIDPRGEIAQLIHQYHIGGVVLSSQNQNFTNTAQKDSIESAESTLGTPQQVAHLNNQLQSLAYGFSLPSALALDSDTQAQLAAITTGAVFNDALAISNTETLTSDLVAQVTEQLDVQLNISNSIVPLDAVFRVNTKLINTDTLSTQIISPMTPITNVSTLANPEPEELKTKLPLLIALEQTGDGLPHTALRNGFTHLPTQLALGSTWNPELVQSVGQIVGSELEAVGVNMLLGPNLDVLEQPRPDEVGRLGVHTFGGSTYWVTQMGQAYIAGIHQGSDYRVATVARHFPGQGDIDRLPDQEVATIQKSLPALERISLPPFIGVTTISPLAPPPIAQSRLLPDSVTDILMSSHMHYSAIQGSDPERAKPLSLSSELQTILRRDDFIEWRERGGLVVSNALGVQAIRRNYELDEENPTFLRRVALDAFIAGNDLLYLDQSSLRPTLSTQGTQTTSANDKNRALSADNMLAIQSTISLFKETYEGAPDFAAQVDSAVRRIVRLKLRLYVSPTDVETGSDATNDVTDANTSTASDDNNAQSDEANTDSGQPSDDDGSALAGANVERDGQVQPASPAETQTNDEQNSLVIPIENVLVREADLALFTPDSQHRIAANDTIGQVARASMTLLYPNIEERPDALPAAPQSDEKILIFSDSRPLKECRTCAVEAAVSRDEIETIINKFYGPDTVGQVLEEQVESYTFEELAALLDAPDELAELLQEADWLIFAMLDVDAEAHPHSDVLKRFLRERDNQLRDKSVVVLSLNAPYFLDATEIAKLTAYVGVYSKAQPFLESAVRALFRSYTVSGAPSISVAGTRFNNLAERLTPASTHLIPLQVLVDDVPLPALSDEQLDEAPTVNVGGRLRLEVGPILDWNGNPVPDGTTIDFQVTYAEDGMNLSIEQAFTRQGRAVREATLERGGDLLILVTSGEATTGETTVLTVQETDPPSAELDTATPTPVPPTLTAISETPEPSVPSGTITPSITTITPTISVTETNEPVEPSIGDTTPTPPDPIDLNGGRTDLLTLGITLLSMLIALSLFFVLQVRIVPRQTLIPHLLWSVIAGLTVYILYALGFIPGSSWLSQRFDILGPVLLVLLVMILTLLWLQLLSLVKPTKLR